MSIERSEQLEVIDLRVRVRVRVDRAEGYLSEFRATDIVTLVRNEVESNLEGLKYVAGVEVEAIGTVRPLVR